MELMLALTGGMLGSAHCVGMCGGLTLLLASQSSSAAQNFLRQGVYSAGRAFTYAFLGAIAGGGGMSLVLRGEEYVPVRSLLALAAGALMIWQGLVATGWLRSLPWLSGARHGAHPGCLLPPLLSTFLKRRGAGPAFLAGVFTGFLPCGLLYAYLVWAASSAEPVTAMARMAAFGLGTAPLMLATGCGARLLAVSSRQTLLRIAACCVVATGVISVERGIAAWPVAGRVPSCPCCEAHAVLAAVPNDR